MEKLNFRFEVDSFNLVPYILEMVLKYNSVYCHSDYMSKILDFSGGMFFMSKNRLHVHRNPLHFVTSIVGARNTYREGKFE